MNKKSYIFVANWKMQFTYSNACAFVQNYAHEFNTLATHNGHQIIICPSFESLSSVSQTIAACTNTLLGAQDCSPHTFGAHTGQIAAQSLAQLQCTYCIIGHSECRIDGKQTDDTVAAKAAQLLRNGITPIVCIGETAQELQEHLTYQVVERQLSPVIQAVKGLSGSAPLLFAYEPVWAIGSDKTPDAAYLTAIFSWLDQFLKQHEFAFKLLYGGSVNAHALAILSTIGQIDGFLVGSASTDYQKFKNIVSWSG